MSAGEAVAAQQANASSVSAVPRGGDRSVNGRVRKPVRENGDSTGMGPAAGAWVTVHRVARDSAGPIDSVRTDAAGRYAMRWRAFGAPDAVYFASLTWDGIAYFTAPLRSSDSRGDEAEITVFDTTSKTFPLSVRGRHLIIGKADSLDQRTIIEVFELSNDSLRTLVTAEVASPAPTWSLGVPSSALDVRATEGEISPDAFAYTSGRVSVFAPIAPGLKQVSFSYKVPASSFPLSFVAEGGAVVFELLLEDPQGTVAAEGFANVDPVTLERRNFRRFLAQDVKDGLRVEVDLPDVSTPARNLYISGLLIGIGLLMMIVLARAVQQRGNAPSASGHLNAPATRPRMVPEHQRLAQEIAALDTMFDAQALPTADERATYEQRRAHLKDALAGALAVVTVAR